MTTRRLRDVLALLAALAVASGLLLAPAAVATPITVTPAKDPGKYNVYVKFINKTDRVIRLYWPGEGREELVGVGGTATKGGSGRSGIDLSGWASWCPGQGTWTPGCPREHELSMKWKNPTVGYPWMETNEYFETAEGFDKKSVRIRFSEGESHTWYPYGRVSKVKMVGQRMDDLSSGTKVWHVTFVNVQ
jgi:hypothetical protein